MSEGAIGGLVVLGILIVFPLFWLSIVWLLSALSGWRNLSRHYGYVGQIPRPQHQYQYLSMGYARILMVSQSGIINISIDDSHLYVSMMWLFRIGHTPLKLPFEDMNISDVKISITKRKCVVTEKAPSVKIHLSARLVKKIEASRLAL